MSKSRTRQSKIAAASRLPRPRPLTVSLAASIRAILASGMVAGCMESEAAELPVPKANWTGGHATREIVDKTMNIDQKDAKIRFNWQSFDICGGCTVNFKQPGASSVAANVIDPNGHPSQIFGHLNANGQIYLINPDGVVFGRGSVVNVGGLVATNLQITDEVLEKGLTKGGNVGSVSDSYAALNGTGAIYLTDPNTGQFVLNAQGEKIKIQAVVEAGALIKAAPGGSVIIAAPEVINKGRIETPNGQTILAGATDKVYLQEHTGIDPATGKDDGTGIHGLLVEVKTGGKVENLGTVLAKQGNATLLGFAVNQQGRVSATTAVRTAGSVRLLAREGGSFVANADGSGVTLAPSSTRRTNAADDGLGTVAKVTLGKDSVTEVLPDLEDTATASIKEVQPKSHVEISGKQVHLQGGARVKAPSGKIDIYATETPADPSIISSLQADTRVLVEKGAVIDAAGLKNVSLSVARNYLKQDVRLNELRDSPLQRNGVLFGKTVIFDRRKLPGIVDVSGALDRYEESVAERSTEGGSVNIKSSGDVILQRGSTIDVSGGSLAYQGATVGVTQLVDAAGRRVDIQNAKGNVTYRGILGDKAGLAAGQTAGRYYEKGYIEGKKGGSLGITTGRLLADGTLSGGTQEGIYQREAAQRPEGGTLSIDLTPSRIQPRNIVLSDAKPIFSDGLGLDSPFPDDPAAADLTLTPEALRESAFRHIGLTTLGVVSLAAEAHLQLPTHGSLSVDAGGLDLQGSVDIPSGTFDAKIKRDTKGIEVGKDARINVSGAWLNEQAPYGIGSGPIALDGGAVSLEATGDIHVRAGAQINADGGAWMDGSGKLHEGKGGSIALIAKGPDGANLDLNGTLSAYALHRGGSLRLESNEILIAQAAPLLDPLAQLQPLWLKPAFFNQGGFQSYQLVSDLGDAVIKGDAHLNLTASNWRLTSASAHTSSQRSLAGLARRVTLPDYERNPVDFSLSLLHLPSRVSAADSLIVEQGASIAADTGAHVQLSADTRVLFDGSIRAPAGRIDLNVVKPVSSDDFLGFLPNQGVFLGSHASLQAPGATRLKANAAGMRFLDIFDGGTVALSAQQGFVVAATGSRIDVSGALDQYDQVSDAGIRRASIATAGGEISFAAPEGILMDADLSARGGDASRRGGVLSVNLDANLRQDRRDSSAIASVGQTPYPVASGLLRVLGFDGGVVPGVWIPGDNLPAGVFREARISDRRIRAGGFSAVGLSVHTPEQLSGVAHPLDEIRFEGNVNLAATDRLELNAPVLGWAAADGVPSGTASLSAAYIKLGSDVIRRAPADPVAGPGTLTATADLIDLVGGTSLNGFDKVHLASRGDIRGIGIKYESTERDFVGEFLTAGEMVLQADQIYPTTLSHFRIAATGDNGHIEFRSNDAATVAPPLSAAGNLVVEARSITQGGVLLAPFGTIEFRGGLDADGNVVKADQITLAPGSITSVSAAGLTIPFGRTSQAGTEWLYPLFNSDQNLTITGTPEKQVVLTAKNIDFAQGATIDFSGGGDLSAYEFAGKGPGGSYDVLSPDGPQVTAANRAPFETKYAILPSLKGGFAPYDPLEFPLGETYGLSMGKTVHLTGVNGVPTGDYALLPARYALLPGAYLVTPVQGMNTLLAGDVQVRSDGVNIASGYYSFAGSSDQTPSGYWQGFAIQPGAFATQQSEILQSTASTFFANSAAATGKSVGLPADAGQLILNPSEQLTLQGILDSQAAVIGARAGRVDIAADALNIVDHLSGTAVAGTVEVLASDLSHLNFGSLLLGGKRQFTPDGTLVEVLSDDVTVKEGVTLSGPEILLAASQHLSVESGATIQAQGSSPGDAGTLLLDGGSALLRASTADVAVVGRTNPDAGHGSMTIADGAVVESSGSVNIDATGDVQLLGRIDMAGGSLGLGANQLNVGEIPAGQSGLNLTSDFLGRFNASKLFLRSSSDVRFYGAATLAADEIMINASGLSGFGSAGRDAQLSAKRVELFNLDQPTAGQTGSGTGALNVTAEELVFGRGDFAVSGFTQHDLTATHFVRGDGAGHFSFGGDLTLTTPIVMSGHGATTQIEAANKHVVLQGGSQAVDPALKPEWGGKWVVAGERIDDSARFVLPSGSVVLQASGDLVLGDRSVTDVAARGLAYRQGKLVPVNGGTVEFASANGNVVLDSGAQVSLAGLPGLSDGGSLKVSTPAGEFQWQGSVSASPGASFELDANTLGAGGFSAVYGRLHAAGFDNRLSLRQRSGDVAVASGQADAAVQAKFLKVVADDSNVGISGRVDLSGADGGEGQFWAGKDLNIAADAAIDAHATASDGRGGKLLFASGRDGTLAAAAGASINVAGGTADRNGLVQFRAYRDAAGNVAVSDIAATVGGARHVYLEAVKSEHASNASAVNTWKTATANFMNNQPPAVQARLSTPVEVIPGLEVTSASNFTLASKLDLLSWRYGGKAGVLTLRAPGDLNLNASLTDAFAVGYVPGATKIAGNKINNYLQDGESWSYRLVGGADLGSADATAVVADGGSVALAHGSAVRTGTGSIDVAAGSDIRLADATSAIYTAGRPDANRYGTLPNTLLQGTWYGEYPVGGGDVTLNAYRNIDGASTPQLITNWLVRLGNFGSVPADHSAFIKRYPTTWGIAFDESTTIVGQTGAGASTNLGFQENVGALGGGNVSIVSGGSINDLSVMLPTTGKQVGQYDAVKKEFLTNEVQVLGGGDLFVSAGEDIRGGVFYVDKGTAVLQAGGSVTGGAQYSDGPLLALGDASMQIQARQDVAIEAAFNPNWVQPLATKNPSYFTTYSDASRISLTSLGGDLVLANDIEQVKNQYVKLDAQGEVSDLVITNQNSDFALRTYPGSLAAYVPSGNLHIQRSFTLFPSPKGKLELVAGGNISSDALGQTGSFVNMSDADRALLPGIDSAISSVQSLLSLGQMLDPNPAQQENGHALVPVHQDDTQPAIIAAIDGSLLGATQSHDPLVFIVPKKTIATAGEDIVGVTFKIQHMSDQDVSVIQAGGDVKFETLRNPVTGELEIADQRIEIAGPGNLNVIAGKNIDLGTSSGIVSIGNRENPSLADHGASLNVFAALPHGLAQDAFIEQYLVQGDFYKADLALYLERKFPEQVSQQYPDYSARLHSDDTATRLSAMNDAVNVFKSLASEQQVEFELRMLFSEIRLSSTAAAVKAGKLDFASALQRLQVADWKQDMDGSASASPVSLPGQTLEARLNGIVNGTTQSSSGYEDAEKAIATLFPKGSIGKGDIKMFYSAIRTLAGGDDNESPLADTTRTPQDRATIAWQHAFSSNDSDINLMTLGGLANLGLASASGGAARAADELGVIVKRDGFANALIDDNFEVNRSRFVANGGGDATVYSNNANIDAGMGSNSAFTPQEDVRSFDAGGLFHQEFLPSVAGSGIQANAKDGERRGNVFLGVPRGQVFINEAGISGDSVVATALVGNMSFVSTAVPTGGSTSAPPSIPTDIGSAASNATRSASDTAAGGTDKDHDKTQGKTAAAIVSVDVVGFGDCSVGDIRDGKAGCGT